MTATKQNDYNVSNLTRGLDILELLLVHPAGMGISEIAQELEIPKNAAFRITSALADRDYLSRDDGTKTFTLSSRLVSMGYRASNRGGLVETAMPAMRVLRDAVKETVVLCIRSGQKCMALDGVPGMHTFRFTVDPGNTAGLHSSAPGKALLAFLPPPQQQTLVTRLKLERFNERTITDRKQLLQELAQVRKLGYAVDFAEEHDGAHCIAAPVFDARSLPVAAITITGPADRLTEKQLKACSEKLRDCAKQISSRLGFVMDADLLAEGGSR